MYILGISAYYHDSAAAILVDGEVVAAVQEERFSRIKNDSSFPLQSILFCLKKAHISIGQIDAIVFYEKPFLKFERILDTCYRSAPFGLPQFVKGVSVWVQEKLFFKSMLHNALSLIEGYRKGDCKLLFSSHHLSHMASAYYASRYNDAAILSIDSVGEWATLSIGKGSGKHIELLKEIHFPDSLGLLYSSFTYFLGFEVNEGEYKLMGLSAYGEIDSEETRNFIKIIKTSLITMHEDGSFYLNQTFFTYMHKMKLIKCSKWSRLFGVEKRNPEDEINQTHCNLALAIQVVMEEVITKIASHAKKITGCENLCMAGGVALNCVANGLLDYQNIFSDVYIQPAAGDAGAALGAAWATHHIYYGKDKSMVSDHDRMKGAMLGPDYSTQEIVRFCQSKGIVYEHVESSEKYDAVAKLLSEGKVVGWFQGCAEYGPRALGCRSILADARGETMQVRLNKKVKFRESFRPFAPAVLKEYAHDFFEINNPSPYMLKVGWVKSCIRDMHPFREVNIFDRIKQKRSPIPAVTHVDYSARIQCVDESVYEFYNLLQAFYRHTQCPVLINTSFNLRGEPIVLDYKDAYNCFKNSDIDVLVLNDVIIKK